MVTERLPWLLAVCVQLAVEGTEGDVAVITTARAVAQYCMLDTGDSMVEAGNTES